MIFDMQTLTYYPKYHQIMLLIQSEFPTIRYMSGKVYDNHDIVTIRYKFEGLKEEIIQCSYFQYKNLKELPDMEICEIIKSESE
ncbi:MAG: hypothetical protein ACKOCQ_06440 [Candidatus Nitrosotenuis sp.]